jgi:glucose-1-phosphate thymidylyltransferase
VLDERGFVQRLVEKPKEPVSNLAVVGIYYLRDSAALFGAIDEVMAGGKQLGGEFYLADALQAMIDHGARFRTGETPVWADCGTTDAILDTNAFLLGHGHGKTPDRLGPGATIVPPVLVDPSATLERSTIGPNATIGPGVHVVGSTVRDSIVYRDARIENCQLHRSLIGARALVRGVRGRANLSDYSEAQGE